MRIETQDCCPGCGWAIEVENKEPPPDPPVAGYYSWWATDGDPAYCSRTGVVTGHVSADGEGAWINTDCPCEGPEYGCGCPFPCDGIPDLED